MENTKKSESFNDTRIRFVPDPYDGYSRAPLIEPIRQPFVCPVCNGRGFVSSGFYNSTGHIWISTTLATETCRTCKGEGIVWYDKYK